jgi:hypothetical protein
MTEIVHHDPHMDEGDYCICLCLDCVDDGGCICKDCPCKEVEW